MERHLEQEEKYGKRGLYGTVIAFFGFQYPLVRQVRLVRQCGYISDL